MLTSGSAVWSGYHAHADHAGINQSRGRREVFRKWRGIGQKGHFCIWPNSTILCRSRAERKFLKIWVSIFYNVGNGHYRALILETGHFLSSKRGRSFKKYFFRALFSLLKKGGAHPPKAPPPPQFRGPWIKGKKNVCILMRWFPICLSFRSINIETVSIKHLTLAFRCF